MIAVVVACLDMDLLLGVTLQDLPGKTAPLISI